MQPAGVDVNAAGNAKGDDATAVLPLSVSGVGGTSRSDSPTKGETKRVLPEKARRELAKHLREATGASARLCEKALQSHADDMERAADWLLAQRDQKGESANGV